jgi:1-acyl-sn-glycerol-3-phosphate acyltransferase
MGKQELFRNCVLGFLLKKVGAFPVDRGNGDTGALDYAVDLIKHRKILGIFPEGTRSKNSELLRPKSGAALIANRSQSKILPVGIIYEEPIRFRAKVRVTYGPIIPFEHLGIDKTSPSNLKTTSKLIISKIAECR